jgi:hypothetical protein
MKEKTDKCAYTTDDLSLNISGREVIYPITAFLEKNLESTDEVKLLLLIKKDEAGHYQKNSADFIEEILCINKEIGAKIEHKYIETDFSEEQSVHEQLMGRIVDELDNGSHIIADITYGPKDLPIVLFSALNFAEKFLGCEIDNIIYGQASFVGGKPTNTKICDMIPLYYLNSVTNTIRCDDPEKARKMLKSNNRNYQYHIFQF